MEIKNDLIYIKVKNLLRKKILFKSKVFFEWIYVVEMGFDVNEVFWNFKNVNIMLEIIDRILFLIYVVLFLLFNVYYWLFFLIEVDKK